MDSSRSQTWPADLQLMITAKQTYSQFSLINRQLFQSHYKKVSLYGGIEQSMFKQKHQKLLRVKQHRQTEYMGLNPV